MFITLDFTALRNPPVIDSDVQGQLLFVNQGSPYHGWILLVSKEEGLKALPDLELHFTYTQDLDFDSVVSGFDENNDEHREARIKHLDDRHKEVVELYQKLAETACEDDEDSPTIRNFLSLYRVDHIFFSYKQRHFRVSSQSM